MATRHLSEIVEFDFEREGVANELLAREAFDKVGDHMVELDDDRRGATDIALESMLAPNGLADIYSLDRAKVDATSKVVVGLAHLAELASEHFERALAEVLACVDAELAEFASRNRSDAPKLFDVKRFDKLQRLVGVDGAESVGFAIVGCHLGEELVVGHASRGNEVEFGADALFDFAGNVNGEFDAWLVVGNVEESLVERDRLYEVGVGVEYLVDLGRNLFIDLHSARHKDEVGAEAFGFDRRHSRAHTKAASLVAGSRHYTTHIAMPHSNWLATKVGIVSLLHRSIKGIQVDVYDFAVHLFCKGTKNSYYF